MFPELLTIGPLTIHTYGFLVALGILLGVLLAEHLHRRSGGTPGRIVDIALIVVVSGLLGARVLFVAVNWGYFAGAPMEIFMPWKGGLVFYGGLIGGVAGLLLSGRIYSLSTVHLLDLAAPALTLGHALGRLGCLSAGCCYGKAADLPWSITFTDPRCLAVAVLGQPVHPTQVYSSAFLFALAGLLVFLHFRKGFPGQVASIYMLLYGSFRFTVEFFRGDLRGGFPLGGLYLSTSQWVSVVMVAVGAGAYFFLARKTGVHQNSGSGIQDPE